MASEPDDESKDPLWAERVTSADVKSRTSFSKQVPRTTGVPPGETLRSLHDVQTHGELRRLADSMSGLTSLGSLGGPSKLNRGIDEWVQQRVDTNKLAQEAARSLLNPPPPPPVRVALPERLEVEFAEHTEEAADFRAGLAQHMLDGIMQAVEAFQADLGRDEEPTLVLANFGQTLRIRIAEITHYPPHLIEFTGVDDNGEPVRLLQHTSQVNMLLARDKVGEDRPARRVGFRVKKIGPSP